MMRLVYVDESARDDRYYFFGALVADARAVRRIEAGFDSTAAFVTSQIRGFDPASEFHATDVFHGRKAWNRVPTRLRVEVCRRVVRAMAESGAGFVFRGIDLDALRARYRDRAFAPHTLTLAHTLAEVDRVLAGFDPRDQLGLVLADDHHSAPDARRDLRDFKAERVPGYTNGPLRRLADTIYFGPSHESRLLQAADVATFFLNRARTITEREERAQRAIATIVGDIRSFTISEYVWVPNARVLRGTTQRPARDGALAGAGDQ